MSHSTECAQSVRIRTDTALDQDSVLKAIVQVCTACMVVSLLTTCNEFQHSSLSRRLHLFDARFASQTRKKAVLQTQKRSTFVMSNRPPRLVYHHSLVLKKSLFSLCHPHSSLGSWLGSQSYSPNRAISQYSRNFVLLVALALLLALALCFCFANCCHGPFIVRSASNFSTFPSVFTQFVHPSRCSRSTLTTVCFCFCFSVSDSAASAPHPSSAHIGFAVFYIGVVTLHQIHHRLRQPSSCSGGVGSLVL